MGISHPEQLYLLQIKFRLHILGIRWSSFPSFKHPPPSTYTPMMGIN